MSVPGRVAPFPCVHAPLVLSIDFYPPPAQLFERYHDPSYGEVAKNGTLHPRPIGRWGNGGFMAINRQQSLTLLPSPPLL
ncbi:hypothetical protein N7451_005845 [Penicillium sp. IBT 35674x]|uniref:Uncharacterized protein n=1 Tax=Penicillium diatomitis TaxID=2819901 RepID=A0A9W9WUE0_9EURO|nr:uncharacterized protein N7539_007940 [Penicillium diatomitis]KAJ5475653.1 hypothetical protein N7539_007940 [Penicillium diatomitis]KAJ6003298.1 hypothetical protein N7451_005845 [Penicillium sp. IBT 35674x]KAJ6134482.1 hypothetical protein N7523_000804 [Penicillium sp. IBT 18751x]